MAYCDKNVLIVVFFNSIGIFSMLLLIFFWCSGLGVVGSALWVGGSSACRYSAIVFPHRLGQYFLMLFISEVEYRELRFILLFIDIFLLVVVILLSYGLVSTGEF